MGQGNLSFSLVHWPHWRCVIANPLLEQGPIPRLVHGVVEYAAGIIFVAAPAVLDFHSTAAVAVSLAVGVLLLVLAAATEGPPGLVSAMTFEVHLVIDFLLASFLIAAPFIFRFSDRDDPTVLFIALGVLHLLVTIGTRFRRGASAARDGR